MHDEDWYATNAVDLRLGVRLVGLDRSAHAVKLADGERIGYTKLLLAKGLSPRRLPGVHYLRRIEDSDRLRGELRSGGRVLVAGAGWIGLEVAAAARAWGCPVTVVSRHRPRCTPCSARASVASSPTCTAATGSSSTSVSASPNSAVSNGVSAVVTTDGHELPADTVVVGVGALPNTDLAEQDGLIVLPGAPGGIVVDAGLRTDDPDIHAAGDVAAVPRWDEGIGDVQDLIRTRRPVDRRHRLRQGMISTLVRRLDRRRHGFADDLRCGR